MHFTGIVSALFYNDINFKMDAFYRIHPFASINKIVSINKRVIGWGNLVYFDQQDPNNLQNCAHQFEGSQIYDYTPSNKSLKEKMQDLLLGEHFLNDSNGKEISRVKIQKKENFANVVETIRRYEYQLKIISEVEDIEMTEKTLTTFFQNIIHLNEEIEASNQAQEKFFFGRTFGLGKIKPIDTNIIGDRLWKLSAKFELQTNVEQTKNTTETAPKKVVEQVKVEPQETYEQFLERIESTKGPFD